jgi:hypothetical protein
MTKYRMCRSATKQHPRWLSKHWQWFQYWAFLWEGNITFLPMKIEQIECSETSEYKIQTPGNCPEENIQQTEGNRFNIHLLSPYISQHDCYCQQGPKNIGSVHQSHKKSTRHAFLSQKIIHDSELCQVHSKTFFASFYYIIRPLQDYKYNLCSRT